MKRARIGENGSVQWSEQCFCPTPLQHERETVYDHYFSDIETQETESYVEFEGEPFMDYLERQARL